MGKRFRTWLVTALEILLTIAALFFIYDLLRARAATPAILKRALDSTQVTLYPEDLSPEQMRILIRVEDPTFFKHQGLDFTTPGAGLTTITQSVGKIFYFRHFNPGLKKIRLMLLARYVITPTISKHDQLTLFLNYMYFGSVDGKPVIGLDQAAQTYYRKPFAELTRTEYISLIGMYPFPNGLDPLHHPEANGERVQRIEDYLAGRIRPKGLLDIYYDGSRVLRPRAPGTEK